MSAVRSIPLSEYDDRWRERFVEIRERLLEAVGAGVASVEHVGGTAVEGQVAKAEIDVDMAVADYSRAYALRGPLEVAGFERSLVGDGVDRQAYLLRQEGRVVCRLSVTYSGSPHLRRDLAVRERLRSDASARRQYGDLKKRWADEPADEATYMSAKEGFITGLVGGGWKAEAESRHFPTRRQAAVAGLVAVLVAALAAGYAYLGYTAEHSRGPDGLPDHRPVLASDLWSRQPATLYYPGSTVISNRGQDASLELNAGPAQVETRLRTDVSVSTLADWYSQRLADLGWTPLASDPGSPATEPDLNWRKGRREYLEVKVLGAPIGTALAYSVRYEIGTGR